MHETSPATKTLRAGPTPSGFRIGLYLEHIEEISCLLEQRGFMRADPETGWRAAERLEERIEAHLDALVLGGELAMEICRQRALAGDAGAVQAAVRVLCRHRNRHRLIDLLPRLPADDALVADAISISLSHELPEEWIDFPRAFLSTRPVILPVLVRVLGYKRMRLEADLAREIRATGAVPLPVFLETFGRLRDKGVCDGVHRVLSADPDETTQAAATKALFRLGDARAWRHCAHVAAGKPWTFEPLALTGKAEASTLLTACFQSRPTAEGALALGLLGFPTCVDLLLQGLENPALTQSCSMGLATLTGEGFAGEIKDWRLWWKENSRRFEPKRAYRLGQVNTPRVLLRALDEDHLPRRLRALAHEEMIIRHGMDFGWEEDLSVGDQLRAIGKCRAWVEKQPLRDHAASSISSF